MERQYGNWYKSLYGIGAAVVCFLLLLPALRFIPVDAQISSSSAVVSGEQEVEMRVRDFFTALMRGNSALALDDLLRGSSLGTGTTSAQQTELRNKTEEIRAEFGTIFSWEKIETKQIGEDVIVVRYVLKHDLHPVVWSFAFYRKPSGTSSITSTLPSTNLNAWVLIGLHFDPNVL